MTIDKNNFHHLFEICQTAKAKKRFDTKVLKKDGCWIWQGCLDRAGYGVFNYVSIEGKYRKAAAHRVAVYIYKSIKPPYNLVACHSCDNPQCVNPDHIRFATQKDNVNDSINRGRFKFLKTRRGEDHRDAKLTEADVRFIRNSDLTDTRLSEILNVSIATINNARAGRNWQHLPNAQVLGNYKYWQQWEIDLVHSGLSNKEISKLTGRNYQGIYYARKKRKI